MGLGMISRVGRDQRQRRTFRPLGHQGHRLRSYNKDPPLHSSHMVAEIYKILLLESPWIPLHHRALAGLSTVRSPSAFLPTLHSSHLAREPKTIRPSALTVAMDIVLGFIPLTIVV